MPRLVPLEESLDLDIELYVLADCGRVGESERPLPRLGCSLPFSCGFGLPRCSVGLCDTVSVSRVVWSGTGRGSGVPESDGS